MFDKVGQEPDAARGEVPSTVVGLDIGGANLKAAVWRGDSVEATATYFPLWKQPERLADGVRELLQTLSLPIDDLSSTARLAVTMTGELADCFATRAEGVEQIIAALCQVVPASRISIYGVSGQWYTPQQAIADPWSVAASNWHGLVKWLANWPPTRFAFAHGVLVDIGSTTVDVIPFSNNQITTSARTDRERLEQSQLIYTGMRRTPVCAVAQSLWLQDKSIPMMAELFATVDDAYLLLGLADEDPSDCDTADNRSRTKANAAGRLARMIGEDAHRLSMHELESLATQVIDAQAAHIAAAISRNLALLEAKDELPYLICSGHGLPLFERTIRKVRALHRVVHLDQYVPAEASRSAPAAAVAWLLQRPNL